MDYPRFVASLVVCVASLFLLAAPFAAGQTSDATRAPGVADLSCSPAPCVLPPIQISEGQNNTYNAPVVADPANPGHLIVGSQDFNCPDPYQSALGFYLSTNGGSSWDLLCMIPLLNNDNEYVPNGNPILGYDSTGAAYIGGFYINNSGESAFGFEGFEKSSDGVTWSSPAPAVIRQDRDPSYCWMTVDTSASSPYVNSVYISCVMVGQDNPTNQVVVSDSHDGGATWQQVPVAPGQSDKAEDLNTAMTAGGDGTVYATWMYCYSVPYECENDKGYMVFSKSSDGGNTWTAPTVLATVELNHMGIPNTSVGVTNTPAIGVDNSDGPHAGYLYVVMYNWTGTFMQVQVVRSTDGGNTWSKPVPVAPGITHDQFFPWLSVSPSGLVGVSWLDRRNDPNNIDYQAFAAISADGGQSFQPNVQLTSNFSNPGVGGERSMGDYTGNTWDGPNYFVAAWMDSSNDVNMQDVVGGIRLK